MRFVRYGFDVNLSPIVSDESESSPGVVHPPFVMLGIGALVAMALGSAFAARLRGDINLDRIGYLVAGGGYALFAALLLWLDGNAARRLPQKTWRSAEAMWGSVLVSTILALVGSLVLGAVVLSVAGHLAEAGHSTVALVVVPGPLLLMIIWGGVRNVRARLTTSIAGAAK
jgi:hypothetical protein